MVLVFYLWRLAIFAIVVAALMGGALACTPIQAPTAVATPPEPANQPTSIDTYQFPILPGTDAWVALESHQAMLEATQIPDAILTQLSTIGLVNTIFAYPMFGDMLAFFDLQEGFTSVATQFNGLQELSKRQDGAMVLLTYYQAMDPAAVDADWSLEKQGEYTFQFIYAEMMLAQAPMLTKLDATARRMLLAEALRKLEAKEQAIDLYGYLSVQSTAFLLAKILYTEQYAPFLAKLNADAALKSFVDKGGNTTIEVFDEITASARVWLEQEEN